MLTVFRYFFGRARGAILGWGITLALLGLYMVGFYDTLAEQRETLYPFIALFAVLFIFATFSLLLSMILPSRTLTATLGGLLLFVSYFISSLAQLDENLRDLAEYLPLRYYQSGKAIHGLNGEWLLGLFGFGLLFALLAWLLFLRRDIRVSGEGTWKLLKARRRR